MDKRKIAAIAVFIAALNLALAYLLLWQAPQPTVGPSANTIKTKLPEPRYDSNVSIEVELSLTSLRR